MILSCGTSEKTCRFAFVIAPDPTTPKENLAFGIEKQIAGQEKTERKVVLPTNVNGREICWKDPGQNLPFQLLGLGVLAAAAVLRRKRAAGNRKTETEAKAVFGVSGICQHAVFAAWRRHDDIRRTAQNGQHVL